MPKQKTKGPTARELDILKVLWKHGRLSLKEIQIAINRNESLAYTAIQTVVTKMLAKRLVARRLEHGKPLIHAAVTEDAARRLAIRRIADELFGGSVAALIGHAIVTQRISPKALSDLKGFIRRAL